jgi:hypothetical protein
VIGQTYSMSRNACMIRFIGGPYDGQSGLYDGAFYDSIGFITEGASYSYVPLEKGKPVYRLNRVIKHRSPSTSGAV